MNSKIVSRSEWIDARKQLLAKEKELTRLRDELSAQRRTLPWVKVTQPYVFSGPQGTQSLADLFGEHSQLIVYHFMYGPGWVEGCKSCSYVADHFEGMLPHLAARDVSLLAVSRAPLHEIEAFRKRMGWRFPWVSSHGCSFNSDYGVSFTKEDLAAGDTYYNYRLRNPATDGEAPGASVFYKDEDGAIFHTYSTYARGLDPLVGTYQYLDLVPKGRDEDALAFTMAWVRHHDRYGDGEAVDPRRGYEAPGTRQGAGAA